MRRSAEFGTTVKTGVRTVTSDIVLYRRRDESDGVGPRVGLIVSKAVGSAVDRHRVSRRLRHVAFTLIDELEPADRVVIRALPGSREVCSTDLERQLRDGLARSRRTMSARR